MTLTDLQNAYLCAFDDLLFARSSDHKDLARSVMTDLKDEMLRGIDPRQCHGRPSTHTLQPVFEVLDI